MREMEEGERQGPIFRDIRRYYCDYCGICRSKKSLITSHVLSHHQDESKEQKVDEYGKAEGVKSSTCEECGASFHKSAYLKQHMQSHSLESHCSRGQSSRASASGMASDGDQDVSEPPTLQLADWNIELIVEDNVVFSAISRPTVNEGYHIDPSYEQVPREYCQDYIDLCTALRRDLRRMSLRNFILTRQLAPNPPRHSSAGKGFGPGARKSSQRR